MFADQSYDTLVYGKVENKDSVMWLEFERFTLKIFFFSRFGFHSTTRYLVIMATLVSVKQVFKLRNFAKYLRNGPFDCVSFPLVPNGFCFIPGRNTSFPRCVCRDRSGSIGTIPMWVTVRIPFFHTCHPHNYVAQFTTQPAKVATFICFYSNQMTLRETHGEQGGRESSAPAWSSIANIQQIHAIEALLPQASFDVKISEINSRCHLFHLSYIIKSNSRSAAASSSILTTS